MREALVLGGLIGVLSMAGPFIAVMFLPGPLQVVMPVLLLGIPLAVQWPRRFDLASEYLTARLLRRLVLVAMAALVAAVVGWVEFTAIPAYGEWADGVHRQSLERQGRNPEEIETAIAQHHQTANSFAFENAVVTAIPGTIAALVTLGVGAVVFRRRPALP